VQTNIVMCRPTGGPAWCAALVARLRERGVLLSQLTPDTVRLVTHRHIGYNEVTSTLDAVRAAVRDGS
jgi:hypothetical protein